MNNNDYKEALFYAASIFNERLGTEFGVDNLVLRCFQTENQQEVFEQFCKQYFPDRLTDQYKYERYCMDDTISREEDGTINAGYAVWRELAAELIAFELDDNCDVVPLRRKKDLLSYYEGELLTGNGKMGVSMILCEAMTSAEGEASMTWDAAKSKFTRFKPFDDPLYRDLLELVFTHVREYFIVIDRDFIYEIGVLYLSIAAQAMIASLKNRFQEE